MDMAYDMSAYSLDTIGKFPVEFVARTFGPEHASEIGNVLRAYYQLNYHRKPEHMGFNTSQNPVSVINPTPFTDAEIRERLAAFDGVAHRDRSPLRLDAHGAARCLLRAYRLSRPRIGASESEAALGRCESSRRRVGRRRCRGEAAETSRAAYDAIQTETAYYNEKLAGGKWKHIMSAAPHDTDVHDLPTPAKVQERQATTRPATQPDAAPAPPSPLNAPTAAGGTFAETNGYLSIAAEHFTRKVDRAEAAWHVIPGLGRLGDSVAVFPTTAPSLDPHDLVARAPALEFDFTTTTPAPRQSSRFKRSPPTASIPVAGCDTRWRSTAKSRNGSTSKPAKYSPAWPANVLRASAMGTTTHTIQPGPHTFRIFMVDPGVVIDHITIDLGGLPKSYLPPAETVAAVK